MDRASVLRRLVGFLIDVSLIFAVAFLAIIPYNLFLPLESTLSRLLLFGTVAGLTAGGLLLIRDVLFEGNSPGHYLTRTQIRTRDGDIPSHRQLILRNVPLFFWPIEAVGVLYYGFRDRFGDTWSGTKVVLDDRSETRGFLLGRWMGAFVVAAGGFYLAMLVMQFNLTTLPPYEKAVEEIHSNPDVVLTVGSVQSVGWFPRGSVSINPRVGTAYFSIKVYGHKDSRWVFVRLINRTQDVWTVTRVHVNSGKIR